MKSETTPGINPNACTDYLSEEELQIVQKLYQKLWYVTNVQRKRCGNSTYRIVLLKPTDFITSNFNIHREIVAIFSDYDTFEPRAFDVLDELNVQELRLEEICSIIISKDEHIDKQIDVILSTNKESRVLVPFTYKELLENDVDDIFVNRMRSKFYCRDLFGIQDALKRDLYFFGRTGLIQEIVNKHENSENVGVFGLRKTGKTSILYAVSRTLKRKNSVPVFIDCQTLHNKPWNLALRHVIQEVTRHCQVKKNEVVKHPHLYESEAYAADEFFRDMQTVLGKSKKRILLIFDEIENITFDTSASAGWCKGMDFVKFWQAVRSAFQRNQSKNVFTYLIAGTNPRCIEVPTVEGVDNPIFQQFIPHYIEPFTVDQTAEMVSRLGGYMGITFSPEVFTHLVEDFGGHPLLIRQMCSYIHKNLGFDSRPFCVHKSEYQDFKENFYREQTGFVLYANMVLIVLSKWYRDEYEMLLYLANDDIDTFKFFADDGCYIQHLINYGIIGRDKTDKGFHFKIESLQSYLIEKHKYRKPLKSDAEKEQEIQSRRSEIEKRLRSLVKRQLKSSLGEEKAKAEMIKKLYGAREIGHKSNIPYKDFFDPSKHEIYLKTCFDVISHNYSCFENLFGVPQEEFDSKSRLFNKYRRVDAHSLPISDADFTTFRGIAEWFESALEDE